MEVLCGTAPMGAFWWQDCMHEQTISLPNLDSNWTQTRIILQKLYKTCSKTIFFLRKEVNSSSGATSSLKAFPNKEAATAQSQKLTDHSHPTSLSQP